MKIWFLNHKIAQCGVYQYGVRLFDILKKSSKNQYIYKEIESLKEYTEWLNTLDNQFHIIMYNFHSTTMQWLSSTNIGKSESMKSTYNICIPHETWLDGFDAYFAIDPDNTDTKYSLNILRPIFEDYARKNTVQNSSIKGPHFGSFGFGFLNKGFDRIITTVSENYDEATITLLITIPHFCGDHFNIEDLKNKLYQIPRKPGIQLNIRTDFISSNDELLQFLESNDVNIFMYDRMDGRGISSAIDYAISVKKPIVISDSYMFKNIYDDSICVYKTPLKQCIENSSKIVEKLFERYSHARLIYDFDSFFMKKFASKLLVDTSIGDAVDKYSILELKQKYVKGLEKRIDIDYEHENLQYIVKKYISEYPMYYRQLVYINDLIWKDTDEVKQLDYLKNPGKFAELSHRIFENNQCRFRIKSWFNTLCNSQVVEQKNHKGTALIIEVEEFTPLHKNVAKIQHACVHYDIVYLCLPTNISGTILQQFRQPNLHIFQNIPRISSLITSCNYVKLSELDDNVIDKVYDFDPISYFASGKLGDFINQLSIVYEKYLETGRKGIVYISNIDPLMYANFDDIHKTYEDTARFIKSLSYIEDYKIKNGEIHTDVNLTLWRNTVYNNPDETYTELHKRVYDVDWAKHPWLQMNYSIGNHSGISWENNTIINITKNRFANDDAIARIREVVADVENVCIFVSNVDEDYHYFIEKTGLNVPLYKPTTFDEYVFIVYSCKTAFLGLSAPATFANALHKKHFLLKAPNNSENKLADTRNSCMHILDFL